MLLLEPLGAFRADEPPPPSGGAGGGRLIGPNRLARSVRDQVWVLPWPEGPWGMGQEGEAP